MLSAYLLLLLLLVREFGEETLLSCGIIFVDDIPLRCFVDHFECSLHELDEFVDRASFHRVFDGFNRIAELLALHFIAGRLHDILTHLFRG